MAELVDALEFGSSNQQKIERGPPYRNSTGPRMSFLKGDRMKKMDKQVLSGDTVRVAYISNHDNHHERRNLLIGKVYNVIRVKEVLHPTIKTYRGASKWYDCTLVDTVSNEILSFRLVQVTKSKEGEANRHYHQKEADKRTLMFKTDFQQKLKLTRLPNIGELNFKLKMMERKRRGEILIDPEAVPF